MNTTFSRNDQRAIVAEFLGTLFFVFVGIGSVVAATAITGGLNSAALLVIALGHGLGFLIAVAWTADISGGHINPAVTLGLVVTRKIAPALAVAYIVAQLAGAVVGALLIKAAIPNDFEGNLGANSVSSVMTVGEGLLLEFLMTMFLVLVIYNVAVSSRGWGLNAPVAIGLAIVVIYLMGVPWTGASVNPARSFGAAVAANQWDDFWVYVVGPGFGGIAIGLFWLWWSGFGDDSLDPVTETPVGSEAAA